MQWLLSILVAVALATQQAAARSSSARMGTCLETEGLDNGTLVLECTGIVDGSEISTILTELGATEVDSISISESPELTSMPDGVFGDTAVHHLSFYDTGLQSLSASVFTSPTAESLQSLYIKQCPDFTKLESSLIGGLSGLERLYLSFSGLTELSDPLPATGLQYIDLTHNKIVTIADDYFIAAEALNIVLLGFNNFSSDSVCCSTQTFTAPDGDLYLDFGYNALSAGLLGFVFPSAAPRELILSGNNIEYLNETTYAPLMDQMGSQYTDAYILLDSNPLQCGCDLSWVVDEPNRHMLKNALCINGQIVDNLSSEDFEDCP